MHCRSIRITGRVQGVFFRESAREKGAELGLNGIVRNEADGAVYAEVEGEEAAIDKFVEWCHEGPEAAQVESVEDKRLPLRDFDGFNVVEPN